MTCIVGVVKEGNVWIGGDLMGSNGFTKKVYPDTKVFVNGDFLFGYTSSFRMGQILQYNWEQPPRIEGMTDRQYLQLDVIESIRNCFEVYGIGEFKNGEHQGGNFLVGYKGCLYEMQDNFSILKNEDFAAVGSGGFHAEAVLKVLTEDPNFDPYYVIQKAIEVASNFTTSVSGECTIVTTDDAYEPPVEDALSDFESICTEFSEVLDYYVEVLGTPREELLSKLDQTLSDKKPEDVDEVSVFEFDVDELQKTADIDYVKMVADSLDIGYAPNIGLDKLRKRVLDEILDTF
jgi:ATP-dependent protease HslVU (ClpYQ) peptidase subunit